MARKIDRYGRNRQFRRNPTRSPKFFPYRLPFIANFSNYRIPSIQEYDDEDGMYDRSHYTPTPKKRKYEQQGDDIFRAYKHAKAFTKRNLEIASFGISAPLKLELAVTQGTKHYDQLSRAYRFVANNYGQSGRFVTFH